MTPEKQEEYIFPGHKELRTTWIQNFENNKTNNFRDTPLLV